VSNPAESPAREPADPVQRWRVVFRRSADAPDAVVRDARRAWDQSLTESGLPAAGLDAGSRPKLALAAPLAAGVAGERELVDVWLTARLPRWQVREALERNLPPGHELVDLYDVWLRTPSLPGQVAASVYRCPLSEGREAGPIADAARDMLEAHQLPRERPKGDSIVVYDLRPMIEDVAIEETDDGGHDLVMILCHHPERGIGRPEEVLAELAARLGADSPPVAVDRLVRERIVLADEDPD
jgi:radical SAM-linked protein